MTRYGTICRYLGGDNPGHFLSSEALRRTIGDGNFSKLLR
jgi:hypothetical protein